MATIRRNKENNMEDENLIIEETMPDVPEEVTPAPVEMTDAEKLELARRYVQENPDEFSHYFTPAPAPEKPVKKETASPTDHFSDITDEYGAVDPGKLSRAQKAASDELTQNLMNGMTNLLAPVMQGFATQQAIQGLPEEAVPYAQKLAQKLGVPLYEAAGNPETMDVIRNAAIGEAYKAGKLKVEMPEGGEPVGGASRAGVLTATQRENLAHYVRVRGEALPAKEVEALRASGALG